MTSFLLWSTKLVWCFWSFPYNEYKWRQMLSISKKEEKTPQNQCIRLVHIGNRLKRAAWTFCYMKMSKCWRNSSPKNKEICWKCAHPQAIQDVDEFVSSLDLKKCSIPSLAHQWILCNEWVPSEWESKQLKQLRNLYRSSTVYKPKTV